MAPTYRSPQAEPPALPFDATQEIDLVFTELQPSGEEPTLTEADFAKFTDLPLSDR